jgi:hypothetical protein
VEGWKPVPRLPTYCGQNKYPALIYTFDKIITELPLLFGIPKRDLMLKNQVYLIRMAPSQCHLYKTALIRWSLASVEMTDYVLLNQHL